MKQVNYEEMIKLMDDASYTALEKDKILGTIKIKEDENLWIYIYLLYFEGCHEMDIHYISPNRIYALVFDARIENVSLETFTLQELNANYLYLCDSFYWDTDFSGIAWWIPAYHHHAELKNEKLLFHFLFNLEVNSRNIFDDEFQRFCLETGYGSVNRIQRYEEAIEQLKFMFECYSYPKLMPVDDDLPF